MPTVAAARQRFVQGAGVSLCAARLSAPRLPTLRGAFHCVDLHRLLTEYAVMLPSLRGAERHILVLKGYYYSSAAPPLIGEGD